MLKLIGGPATSRPGVIEMGTDCTEPTATVSAGATVAAPRSDSKKVTNPVSDEVIPRATLWVSAASPWLSDDCTDIEASRLSRKAPTALREGANEAEMAFPSPESP